MRIKVWSRRLRNEGKAEVVGKPVASHGGKFNVKSKAHVFTAPQHFFPCPPPFFFFFLAIILKLKKKLNFLSDDVSSVFWVAVV